MASSSKFSSIIFFFFLCSSLFLHGTLAEVICEDLPVNLCSFAIASSGKRCVLENDVNEQGSLDYTCTSSEVVGQKLAAYIETDRCVNACGVNRESVGISSDAFLTPHFTSSLCSPDCFRNCPNIVDMYFNLAAGEECFCRRSVRNTSPILTVQCLSS